MVVPSHAEHSYFRTRGLGRIDQRLNHQPAQPHPACVGMDHDLGQFDDVTDRPLRRRTPASERLNAPTVQAENQSRSPCGSRSVPPTQPVQRLVPSRPPQPPHCSALVDHRRDDSVNSVDLRGIETFKPLSGRRLCSHGADYVGHRQTAEIRSGSTEIQGWMASGRAHACC